MTTTRKTMTDEHDTDDGGEQARFRTTHTKELDGATGVLDALGIGYTVHRVYEIRADAAPPDGDENADTLGDVTKQAAELDLASEDDEPAADLPECPHGCGTMVDPTHGDPLEPEFPYCPECGHIAGNGCSDGCHYHDDEDAEDESGNGPVEPASGSDSSADSSSPDSPDDGESDGDAGNGSSPDSTTDTTSGAAPTDASSTTSDPMPEERREQLDGYLDGIFTLDHSEAGKQVYGAIANTNREWAAVPEIPVADEDLPGDTPVNTVARHMWRGGIFDRRELEGRTVKRCTYEYRIAPDKRGAGE